MRAVLVATDFIKDIDNTFKALEINTAVSLVVKDLSNYLNLTEFDEFLSNNGIDTIEFITPKQGYDGVYDVDAGTDTLSFVKDSLPTYLMGHYSGSTITFNNHITEKTAITVPFIEDAPNKLILRVSYDTTALIDDVYSRDNWEFLKLMSDADTTSVPKTYFNHSELGFDSIGENIRDNNGFPNFIIKERFPTENYQQYPKVLKIDTVEQLNNIKNGLLPEEYLQEYIYNPNDTLNGKLKTYRTVTMIYGGELSTFNFMSPFVHTNQVAPKTTVDYDDNGYIQSWERPCFIQKVGVKFGRGPLTTKIYHFDDTSKILMSDGTIKNMDTLNLGDSIKTLDIPNVPQDEENVLEWKANYSSFSGTPVETLTTVEAKESTNAIEWLTNVTLEDGIEFSDITNSIVLVRKQNELDEVRFDSFLNITVGDFFVLYDLDKKEYIQKQVEKIEYSYENIKVHTVDVEPIDTFLTTQENVETPTYAMIQHNPPIACQGWCCSVGIYNAYSCLNYGADGFCYITYTYEYCSSLNPSTYYCSACSTGCADCAGGIKA